MPNVEKNQDQQQQISDSNQTLQAELNHQQEQLQPQQKTKHASTTTLSLGSGAPFLPRPPPLGISGMHGHAPLTHIPSQHDLDPDHPQSHKSSGPASSVASSWVFDKDGHERPRHGRLGKISKGFSTVFFTDFLSPDDISNWLYPYNRFSSEFFVSSSFLCYFYLSHHSLIYYDVFPPTFYHTLRL